MGTCIGAGQRERALRATWVGAGMAFVLTEVIGLAAALFPRGGVDLAVAYHQRGDQAMRDGLAADEQVVALLHLPPAGRLGRRRVLPGAAELERRSLGVDSCGSLEDDRSLFRHGANSTPGGPESLGWLP